MNMKIIIGLLGGLVVVQIIGALIFFHFSAKSDRTISQTNNQIDNIRSTNPIGKIELKADHSEIQIGDIVAVSIMVDTDTKPVDGIDISLSYDPKILMPIVVDKQAIIPGKLFPDVAFNAFNTKEGTASMSAISTLNKNFAGEGTMGVISFKALAKGSTMVKVVAQPGNTTDSNMVAEGKEILTETKDAAITIQ